ncbi:MAG: hypothetical protein WDZ31_01350 [Phycisphaeraceae bacterium]
MIVYCCADLIFATRIRATAEALGLVTRPVRDAEMLRKRLEQVDDGTPGRPNDPVTALMLDLDAGEPALPLIKQTKQHDPTIPVIAFGPHVAVDLLDAAKQQGADVVLPRGAFTARLPDLLRQYAGGA